MVIGMFDSWGVSDWLILVIDLIAIAIIVRFLSWKIKHKLAEVEQRQQFSIDKRKKKREMLLSGTQEE